jgi:hypothetical protein
VHTKISPLLPSRLGDDLGKTESDPDWDLGIDKVISRVGLGLALDFLHRGELRIAEDLLDGSQILLKFTPWIHATKRSKEGGVVNEEHRDNRMRDRPENEESFSSNQRRILDPSRLDGTRRSGTCRRHLWALTAQR